MTGQTKKSILVIDDAPENIDLVHYAISSDFKVIAALSGEDALEILEEGIVPDLVLTDIIMPGIDGYQVCEYVRTNVNTQNIPVVFISGTINDEVRETGRVAGGNDFISKPFSIKGLSEKLTMILNNK